MMLSRVMAVNLCAGFFAAMGKVGGGRYELDPRFVSMFCVFNLTFPSDDAIKHIYRSILAGHTATFAEDIQRTVPVIVEITLSLYKVRNTIDNNSGVILSALVLHIQTHLMQQTMMVRMVMECGV
jgi:hypothetical protein